MNSVENLESLWERLAEAIDRAGREHEVLFLSKLALLLGNEIGLHLCIRPFSGIVMTPGHNGFRPLSSPLIRRSRRP